MSGEIHHLPVFEQQPDHQEMPQQQMLGHSATFGEDTQTHQEQQQQPRNDSFKKESSATKRGSNARKAQVDLNNYKGNYASDNNVEGKSGEVRYSCPTTGAHFEFSNMCDKLEELSKYLAEMEAKQAAKHEAKRAEDEKLQLAKPENQRDIGEAGPRNHDIPMIKEILVDTNTLHVPEDGDHVLGQGEDESNRHNNLDPDDIKRRSIMRPVTAMLDTTSKRTSNAEVQRISFLKAEGNQIIFKNDLANMTIIEEPETKIKEEDTQQDSQIKSQDRRDTDIIGKIQVADGEPIVQIRRDTTVNNETLLRDNSGNVLKSLLQQDVGDPSFVATEGQQNPHILQSSAHFQKQPSDVNKTLSNGAQRYQQRDDSVISVIHQENDPNIKRSTLNPSTELIGDKSNFPKEGDITVTQDFLEASGSFTRANIPEKYNGSLLELQTASIKQTETSIKVDPHIAENYPQDDTKPIDPFVESSIRHAGGGSLQSILAPSSQGKFDEPIVVDKGILHGKRSSVGQTNQAHPQWDIKGASNINLTPKRGTCSLVHIVDDSRSPTTHIKRDTDQHTIDNQKSQESYQPVKVVIQSNPSTAGFRKEREQPTKTTTENSLKKAKNNKGSFKSDAPLKVAAPQIEPFHLDSTQRHETDTQDTPLPMSDFSKEKDVGLLKSDDVKEYLKNTRLMIKARQQQLSHEMQLEHTTVNIKALYDNKNLQKQSPFRNCRVGVEHRNSQHLVQKKQDLESEINALTDEMKFNDDHQKRLLNTYKMKILDTEKDISRWQRPTAAKIPFSIKRPTYNTYIQKSGVSSVQKEQKAPYQRFFNASPFSDLESCEINKRAADYALKTLSKNNSSKNFHASSPGKFDMITPSLKLEPIDEISMNNSSQITPDYQKKMNLKPPRKPAPYKSFKQIMNEGTPMQGQQRTAKMNAQGFTPILQTVNENDRYSQTMDKETKHSSGMTYGMNKQGQGSRPCSQSQLARIAQPLSSPSETQKEFFSRFTEHRQQKSASNSVDFMMLSLGNLVAVPKVPQPPIHQLPNAHSLKIVGHFSDVPIESQQQSRDYNNFTRIKNVPLLHMQPPKGNGIKSRHRAHEGESYHHNCPMLYSEKHLSYQSSLNSLFF